MSEDITPADEASATEAAPAPKVRRISNKNPRKKAVEQTDEAPAESPAAAPVDAGEQEDSSSDEIRPPEGEEGRTAAAADSSSAEPKRKNRRRRGKGKSKDSDAREEGGASAEETIQIAYEEFDSSTESSEQPARTPQAPSQQSQQQPPPSQNQQPSRQPQQQKPRRRLDPERVATRAWKIYLAEVSEEGVALIGDNDARELARRCFRLSELFLEEQERRT